MGKPRGALFDMDRTLLSKETASLYVRYQREIGEASAEDMARTLWWVLQYTMGILDTTKIAEKVLKTLEGVPEIIIAARCDDWFATHVERFITDGGRLAVKDHLERGDVCAIVTGASAYASRPLAQRLEIPHVVSSVFEVDAAHRFTGRPEPPLCFGPGKLTRARRFAEEQGFDLREAAFYTDSISDLPLMEAVGEPIAVNPDPRLKRVALRRGWPVVRW